MSGIYTTTNVKYNPVELKDMLIPLEYLTKNHEAVDEELSKTEALTHSSLARLDPNSQAYQTKLNFLNGLQAQRDALLNEGYSPKLKYNMNTLKSEYANKIIPIEEALKELIANRTFVNDTKSKNPLAIFDISGEQYNNIDYLVQNPGSRPDYVDGSIYHKFVSDTLQNLTKQYLGDVTSFENIIDKLGVDDATKDNLMNNYALGMYNSYRGYNAEGFNSKNFIDSIDTNKLVKDLANSAFNINSNRFSPEAMRRFDDIFRSASFHGIGQEDMQQYHYPIGNKIGNKNSSNNTNKPSEIHVNTINGISQSEESSEYKESTRAIAGLLQGNNAYTFNSPISFKDGHRLSLATLAEALENAPETKDINVNRVSEHFRNAPIMDENGYFYNWKEMKDISSRAGYKLDDKASRLYYIAAQYFKAKGGDVTIGVHPITDSKGNITNWEQVANSIRINESARSMALAMSEEARKYNPYSIKSIRINNTDKNAKNSVFGALTNTEGNIVAKQVMGYSPEGELILSSDDKEVKLKGESSEDFDTIVYQMPLNAKNNDYIVATVNGVPYAVPLAAITDRRDDIKKSASLYKDAREEYVKEFKNKINTITLADNNGNNFQLLDDIRNRAKALAVYTKNGKTLTDNKLYQRYVDVFINKVIETGEYSKNGISYKVDIGDDELKSLYREATNLTISNVYSMLMTSVFGSDKGNVSDVNKFKYPTGETE